jgi:hypothetical protein
MTHKERVGGQPRVPNETALRGLPARAAHFLHAAGSHPEIRELLARGGYGAEAHAEGMALLTRVCAYHAAPIRLEDDERVREAEAALRDWVRLHVPRLRAAVERLCPDALSVFDEPLAHDASATLFVSALLDRLAAREDRNRSDAVFSVLDRRGFTPSERTRLVELAARVRNLPVTNAAEGDSERAPSTDLVALHDWLEDWSTTAKAFITRRDFLIRLGLVRRVNRAPKTDA